MRESSQRRAGTLTSTQDDVASDHEGNLLTCNERSPNPTGIRANWRDCPIETGLFRDPCQVPLREQIQRHRQASNSALDALLSALPMKKLGIGE